MQARITTSGYHGVIQDEEWPNLTKETLFALLNDFIVKRQTDEICLKLQLAWPPPVEVFQNETDS